MKDNKLIVAYIDHNNVNSFEFVQMVDDLNDVEYKDALIFRENGEVIIHIDTSTKDRKGNSIHNSGRNIYLDAGLLERLLRGLARGTK